MGTMENDKYELMIQKKKERNRGIRKQETEKARKKIKQKAHPRGTSVIFGPSSKLEPNLTPTRAPQGQPSSQDIQEAHQLGTKATFGPCLSMGQMWLIHEQGKLNKLTKSPCLIHVFS
ncbi:hypothetical protein PIB30_068652 [Stylosanthes scabra]|uniref:Uncharacterized protein n=1 Tax=Stylosanthes scabra TaxID=79078 RepID=A0ABU6YLV3_9FABA|nr:hypothetical protein [Stylosanthes scabra]